MKIIRPITITDAVFTSSNIAETDATAFAYTTVYGVGNRCMDSHKVYELLTASNLAVVTITIANPGVITWAAHGLASGTPIKFKTTGALPTGIVAGTTYYVKYPLANTFSLSATVGGATITTSGSQSGTQTAVIPPGVTAYWLEIGTTNKWAMFDGSVTSQSSNLTSIATVIAATGRVDSVVLLNSSAANARIVVTDATLGVLYDQTHNMISDSGILDWWSYFYEPVERLSDIAITNIPPNNNPSISITLADPDTTVLCGACVVGLSKEIGGTQYGASVGIQDYSVKTQDDFGVYTVLQRSFSKRASFSVWVDGAYTDSLHKLLASYRSIPVVYVGSEDYSSTIIYGFYKDFSIDIAYLNVSMCSLEIEGLT